MDQWRVCLALLIFQTLSLTSTNGGYVREVKRSKYSLTPLKTVHGTSFVQCVSRCKRTQGCKRVNHQADKKTCELLDASVGNGVLEEDGDWNHYIVSVCQPTYKISSGRLDFYHREP